MEETKTADGNSGVEETEESGSVLQWGRLSRFNHIIWTVLVGTLLARTTYFMAWPFLIVILYQDFNAGAVTVGTILAGSAVVGSFTGLLLRFHIQELVLRTLFFNYLFW